MAGERDPRQRRGRAARPQPKGEPAPGRRGFGPFAGDGDGTPVRRPRARRPGPPDTDTARSSRLRVVRSDRQAKPAKTAAAPKPAKTARATRGRRPEPGAVPPRARRRRRASSADVRAEILRLGGRRGERLLSQLLEAADAYAHDRERVAVRILQPVRDAIPDAPSVRELLGLALYRLGRYGAAGKELAEYARLSGAVDQHPVLMDSLRALRRYRRVDELWRELAAASPSAALVTEGRIVVAGGLADRGRLDDAIRLLDRRAGPVKRPAEHHLRLWYALADLEDRSGNAPRARELFRRVEQHDRAFADVAERLAALR